MARKNYSKISEKAKKENASAEIEIDKTSILTPEEVADLKEEEVVTVNEKADLIGVVTGCSKLYVRTEPNKDSKPLCIINQNAEVVINEKTTGDFYKVCTSAGVEGYCMKKFISIK